MLDIGRQQGEEDIVSLIRNSMSIRHMSGHRELLWDIVLSLLRKDVEGTEGVKNKASLTLSGCGQGRLKGM